MELRFLLQNEPSQQSWLFDLDPHFSYNLILYWREGACLLSQLVFVLDIYISFHLFLSVFSFLLWFVLWAVTYRCVFHMFIKLNSSVCQLSTPSVSHASLLLCIDGGLSPCWISWVPAVNTWRYPPDVSVTSLHPPLLCFSCFCLPRDHFSLEQCFPIEIQCQTHNVILDFLVVTLEKLKRGWAW